MDYELIHDITRADIAVRVKGLSPDDLFVRAGRALISEMTEDISSINRDVYIDGELRTTELDMLFIEFLNEIVFYKDSRSLLLLPETVHITCDSGTYLCRYSLSGEKINRDKHEFRVDIKAVTLHGLRLYREGDSYIAETVFDV